jgi:hypothetical protein
MLRSRGFLIAALVAWGSGFDASPAVAAPAPPAEIAAESTDEDLVSRSTPSVSKALQDTVWIAEWSFDAPGGGCTEAGWVKWDNRILNVHEDSEFWHVDNRFDGFGPISGRAAILSHHNLCWDQDGYGNNNDFSIILKYSGSTATLAFDKVSDSEPLFDFVTVEGDSAGASEALGDPTVSPGDGPAFYRDELLSTDGVDLGSHVAVSLPDYGPGVHEVYIRFVSDGGYSDEDGLYPTALQAGLVVDNIVVTGDIAYAENFEGALNANVTLIETANARRFRDAPWLRVFSHITDNEPCQENLTCAWLGTDPTQTAFQPNMAFGPGGAVIRNWLDDIMASPWVSLASTPVNQGTILRFRRFPGNVLSSGAISHGWRVRTKKRADNTDTPAPGDSVDCVSPWGHAAQFNSLDPMVWVTSTFDMTPHFDPTGHEIQVSFRTVDRQWLANQDPPWVLNTGPGPFLDDIRIGRRVLAAPLVSEGVDSRSQAQDAFPTVVDPSIAGGEHFVPDGANRFGTCAFSQGGDLGINTSSTRLVTGDSIWLHVADARGAGGLASVRVYAAITTGPHQGKVPGPYASVGGFFEVNADSARNASGAVVANRWFVDLDDTYFRGGDVLKYFWAAVDNQGAFASVPAGITALPTSVAQAEAATAGLHEVNYLPRIIWDPTYLAAVQAHPTGDVNPTPTQIANSTQRSCILYYQKTTSRRRSGPTQRTNFMYTLDELGYSGRYDVYDVQGYGNTANQLAGRANVTQCSGYALIIQDDGRSNLTPNVPNGENHDNSQLRQADWYRSYLAQGTTGLAGTATFWSIGENTGFLHRTNPLFAIDAGLSGVVNNQLVAVSPTVRGKTTNTWATGSMTDFTGDEFALSGGCPSVRAYDAANANGGATTTHRYAAGATEGQGAIIMNRNAALEWNTVWCGFGWLDIRYQGMPASPGPQEILATKVLNGTLPVTCSGGEPTGVPIEQAPSAVPDVSALHQNVPNPFNPTTKVTFDLARNGQVRLQVFNVAGHLVKTLVNGTLPAKRNHEVVWNGLDEAGKRVPSGVYFYQLVTDELTATKKMALLK